MALYVSTAQIAHIVRMTPAAIYYLCRNNRIPSKYVKGRIKVPLEIALVAISGQRNPLVQLHVAKKLIRDELGMHYYEEALEALRAIADEDAYTVDAEALERLIVDLKPQARWAFAKLAENDPDTQLEPRGCTLFD